MRILALLLLMSVPSLANYPGGTVIPLWNGPAPQSHGTTPDDIPTLRYYLPANATAATPAVVICPGGGYVMLALPHEGYNEALWFQAHDVAAFVLTYRLPQKGYRHPVPLLDAQRALRLVRSRAAEWKIDPAKIGVMGFSAGGHLASTLETHFDAGNPAASDPIDRASCRPDFAVLVYAVITFIDPASTGAETSCIHQLLGLNPDPALRKNLSSETQVTAQTPPTILVHALDDPMVRVANAQLMLAALQKAGVPSTLQEYPHGGHGFGFGGNPDKSPPGWLDHVYAWLKAQGFMP